MSGLWSSVQPVLGKLSTVFQDVFNKILPAEKRAEILSKLQEYAISNPKLAAFTISQILFTGLPLLLFITFGITVFLISLVAALLIGLLVAILFTVLMVLVALLVVLPTIFLTTFAATFVFLCGLGGYYLLKWFNDGELPALDIKSIGEKINNLTGGRFSWLTDSAREKSKDAAKSVEKPSKADSSTKEDEEGSTTGSDAPKKSSSGASKGNSDGHSGGAKKPPKLADSATKHTETVKDTPAKQGEAVQQKGSKVAGDAATAKGAASEATGN